MKKNTLITVALLLLIIQINKSFAQQRILIITSNNHYFGNTKIPTGNHFEEIVRAYNIFNYSGFKVDIVSSQGGAIPLNHINTSDSIQKRYLFDGSFMDLLEHTLKPNQIFPKNYSAVYFSGGGSAMFGVADNIEIQKIALQIFENNGIISAVCHGTAGIVFLKDPGGNSIYRGKKITGFPSFFERKNQPYYQTFSFDIDSIIRVNGGEFVFSDKGWDGFFVIDGQFITGQDPSSVVNVANKIVEKLKLQNH